MIRDISFCLPSGQLTLVVGNVKIQRKESHWSIATPGGASSGKTSLLSALLRELRLLGGEREVEAGDQYSRYALLRWAKLRSVICLHIFEIDFSYFH